MTDFNRDAGSLHDEDRLPWLEAVDDDADDDRISTGKLIGFVVAALIALGVVIGGVALLRSQDTGLKGDGKLIAAQPGDYKVKPDTPGGMKVEGQGDSAFAASEGAEANGTIDLNAGPEAPVTGAKLTKVKPAPLAKPVATASVPVSGGKLVAPPPARPVAGKGLAAPEGSLVQLGSFNSEAQANAAWTSLAKRFAYLSALSKTVIPAQVNGTTFYRLRANAGDQAGTICSKLKIAGENCLLVN